MLNFLPDAEQAIIDKLGRANLGVPIGSREPSPRPIKYIKIFLGGSGGNPPATYESFMVTIEAWAKGNETAANSLAMKAHKEILRWGWGRGEYLENDGVKSYIQKVAGGRPINYPDADGWARYTATYQFTISH